MLVAHDALYAAVSFALASPTVTNDGAALTAFTVMVNVWVAEVSTPPFAVPPLSVRNTLIVAVPLAFGAGVNVRTPLAETVGCALKSALLSFEAWNVST